MASGDIATTAAAYDDLDDLLDHNDPTDDPLRPVDANMEAPALPPPPRPKPVDLGIDEEVVTRRRKPIPKLDEDRCVVSMACTSKGD